MSGKIRILHHPTSQPCRAVLQLLLENGIEFEEQIIDLMSGENEVPTFKDNYNPTGQVPILVDGDFTLWESPAIAFYINEKYQLPSNWFGADIRQRALIQQYCHFHATMLRRGAGAFFYTHFAECIWGARDYSREIALGRFVLEESMAVMEGWLSRSRYLCGGEISFADLLGFHEFMSHHAGHIISDETWAKYPGVKSWFDRIHERECTKPVSEMIMAVGAMRMSGQLIPMSRKTSLAKGTAVDPGVPDKVS